MVRSLLALFAAVLCLLGTSQANPVISEFMADNGTTIRDEDGAYSDWIEIHNPTAAPIDLTNWCLTDDAAALTKWRFPAVILAPGDFLLVWASSKNRRIPGAPLHTNFALAAGGEYLALVQPDGTTITQHFSPAYPPQAKDESHGLLFSSNLLVTPGAVARYHIPGSGTLGSTWTQTTFNDGTWSTGATGVGYGLMVPGITVRSVKKNPDFGSLTSLAQTLDLLAQPAGSAQIAADVTVVVPVVNFLGDGSDGHYGNNRPFPSGGPDEHCIRATGTIVIPTAGAWTFGLNSDDGGRIRINGVDVMVDDSNHAPTDHFGTVTLPAGSHTFEVIMWEGGGGDEVEFFAAPGTFNTWGAQFKLVGDTANGGLAAFTSPVGGGSVIGTNVESQMRNVNSTLYLRVPFTATNTAAIKSLNLQMRYNDGFIAYLNGSEIARRAAPVTPAYNSAATSARSQDQSLEAEPISISSSLPQLREGSNVLAIHGLNITAGDSSFLVLPELSGGALVNGDPAFFKPATPGAINGLPSSLGKVADTQFSHKRGIYTAAFQLTISTPTPQAQIRYTLDGSTPTETNGIIYSGPISISKTTILRTAAFREGWLATNVDTQTYLFLDDVIRQSPNGEVPPGFVPSGTNGHTLNYGMDPDIVNSTNANIGGAVQVKNALAAIPSVSIVTDPSNLWSTNRGIYVNPGGRGFQWERPCSIELLNDPAGGFKVEAGVRIRGGFSRSSGNPKHAFHFFFRGEYGDPKLRYPLFGREGASEFDQLDLRTAQNYSWSFGGDSRNTFLREEFSRDAQGAMGQPYARCRYYHLYLNGHYWGLFNTEERTEASYSATYLGGQKEDYDVVKAEQTADYTVGATDGNLSAWQDLWTKARAHAASPTNANFFKMMGRAADGVTPTADPVLLDVDNLIDYMLLTFWTGNEDGATSSFLGNSRANNWFASRRRNGDRGFVFFAHDFEHSFGLPGGGPSVDRTGPFISSNQNDFRYSNPMFLHQDLMANAEYRIRFADRVHKHLFNDGPLTTTASRALINARAAVVENVITAESARWGDSKTEPPRTRVDWRTARDYLLNTFIPTRGSTLLGQLRTDNLYPTVVAPTIGQFGGYISNTTEVTVSGTATIYYTTDGSDPRLVGGALNPAASTYVSGTTRLFLTGAGEKRLRLRTRSGTTWSALVDALFLVNTVPAQLGNLAITAMMYNPAPPTASEIAAGFTDAQMFEWLELTNTNATTIDLAGLYFSNGIDFDLGKSSLGRTLAPGARIILVANRAAFEQRYGTGKPIAGEYTGSLSNGGELISIVNATGTTVQSLTYDDAAPWPTDADGTGYSLVLRKFSLNPADPTSWRASSTFGGSPGVSDSTTFAAWKLANSASADHADDDHDGVSNWFEYVLGGSRGANDAWRLPKASAESFTTGGIPRQFVTITLPRRVAADDVTASIEGAVTLGSWNPNRAVLVRTSRNADGTEISVYRSVSPAAEGSQEFFRLRAVHSP